jgi:hypothetical protein
MPKSEAVPSAREFHESISGAPGSPALLSRCHVDPNVTFEHNHGHDCENDPWETTSKYESTLVEKRQVERLVVPVQ